MLQIFIRPREANLPGTVHFHDRSAALTQGTWHMIGGPEDGSAPLKIRQQVAVYEARLTEGQEVSVPTDEGMAPWLYVMDGEVRAGNVELGKGDALTDIDGPLPAIHAESQTTLVAFLVDRSARASEAGTISGR